MAAAAAFCAVNMEIEFLSGVFEGKSTGTPIGFEVRNQNQHSQDYENSELQHAIEKAVILSDGGMISAEDIDGGNQQKREKPLEEVQTLDEMESRMIEKTIRECEGNLSVVAARLGISRQTLYISFSMIM